MSTLAVKLDLQLKQGRYQMQELTIVSGAMQKDKHTIK
jgi:hypothetical protein